MNWDECKIKNFVKEIQTDDARRLIREINELRIKLINKYLK